MSHTYGAIAGLLAACDCPNVKARVLAHPAPRVWCVLRLLESGSERA